ncbi:hypothetical protein DFH06DRAFT_1291940 [Mycena polygramma]|nr:hypothetical protein DFH06DRAFT_1291940 [Mycena polygramma]
MVGNLSSSGRFSLARVRSRFGHKGDDDMERGQRIREATVYHGGSVSPAGPVRMENLEIMIQPPRKDFQYIVRLEDTNTDLRVGIAVSGRRNPSEHEQIVQRGYGDLPGTFRGLDAAAMREGAFGPTAATQPTQGASPAATMQIVVQLPIIVSSFNVRRRLNLNGEDKPSIGLHIRGQMFQKELNSTLNAARARNVEIGHPGLSGKVQNSGADQRINNSADNLDPRQVVTLRAGGPQIDSTRGLRCVALKRRRKAHVQFNLEGETSWPAARSEDQNKGAYTYPFKAQCLNAKGTLDGDIIIYRFMPGPEVAERNSFTEREFQIKTNLALNVRARSPCSSRRTRHLTAQYLALCCAASVRAGGSNEAARKACQLSGLIAEYARQHNFTRAAERPKVYISGPALDLMRTGLGREEAPGILDIIAGAVDDEEDDSNSNGRLWCNDRVTSFSSVALKVVCNDSSVVFGRFFRRCGGQPVSSREVGITARMAFLVHNMFGAAGNIGSPPNLTEDAARRATYTAQISRMDFARGE